MYFGLLLSRHFYFYSFVPFFLYVRHVTVEFIPPPQALKAFVRKGYFEKTQIPFHEQQIFAALNNDVKFLVHRQTRMSVSESSAMPNCSPE